MRYKTHPSIRLIKEQVTQLDDRFSFEQIPYEDVHKEIRKLDCMKAPQDTHLPSNIIKENAGIFANSPYFSFNKTVSDCEFSKSFKNTNVSPIYNKVSSYRLISILPNLLKIYERIMHSQISA